MQIRLTSKPSRRRTPSWGRSRAGALFVAAFMAVGFLQAAPAFAAVPELSVKNVRVTETDSYNTTATVRVVLSAPATRRVTAEYTTLDGTAKGADYVRQSGTLVIPRGRQSATIPVTVKGDELDERNEYFRFRISEPVHATIADRVGLVRILDNDPQPYLDAGELTVTEPVSGVAVAKLPVTLSAVSGRWVYVDYLVSAGSATVDTDFYAAEPTGTLVFPPGTTSRSVSIVVLSDLLDESAESVYLTLYDPVHSYIYDGTGVATIVEDEPSLSVDDRTVVEGQTATFTVKLDRVSNKTVTVYYATSSGTAASSSDFYPTSGYLTFSPGTPSKTVTVYTIDDSASENTETFTLNLSSAVNADIADSRGTGTITDNDGPILNVGDVTVTEGSSAGFRVYLSAKATTDVTFDYVTAEGSADEPSDFTYRSGNNVVISKGQTEITVYVSTEDDKVDESSEVFYLNVSDIHNAKPGDVQGKATILDNDPSVTPTLFVSYDPEDDEGDDEDFVVSLTAPATEVVTFRYATADGTAKAEADYAGVTGSTGSIGVGKTSVPIAVETIDDSIDEVNETFYLIVYDVRNAVSGDLTGMATILDNDPEPKLGFTSLTADTKEGDTLKLEVTLTPVSEKTVTVGWTATGSGGTKATATEDFTPVTGTLTFAPGDASELVVIEIPDDKVQELAEAFTVTLSSSPVNADLATDKGSAVVTIAASD